MPIGEESDYWSQQRAEATARAIRRIIDEQFLTPSQMEQLLEGLQEFSSMLPSCLNCLLSGANKELSEWNLKTLFTNGCQTKKTHSQTHATFQV
jgi:hypothetical protein